VQDGVGKIDLIPTQVYKLGRPQAVAEGDKTGSFRRTRSFRLIQAGKASPSLPIPAIVSNATALRGIGLQLFGFDWSSKRA
jgi:hypothetical protein